MNALESSATALIDRSAPVIDTVEIARKSSGDAA